MNDPKLYLYAGIAIFTTLQSNTTPPITEWDWFRYITGAILSGLVAAKAYTSDPKPTKP